MNTEYDDFYGSTVAFDGESYVLLPEEQMTDAASTSLVTYMVWTVLFLISGALFMAGQRVAAVLSLGIPAVAYGTFKPRVAIYVLLAMIPLEWTIGISRYFTISKIIAIWVLIVSIPKIVRTFGRRWDPCAKWIAAMIVWTGISILWAQYQLPAVSYWQTTLLIWSMPLLICLHLDSRSALRTALFFFVAACAISCVGFLLAGDIHTLANVGFKRLEAKTIFGMTEADTETNELPRFFALAIFMCIFLITDLKNNLVRLLLGATIVFMGVGILLAKTRAVYIAFPMALIVGFTLQGGGFGKRIVYLILIGIFVGATIFVAGQFGLLGGGVQERFMTIFEKGASTSSGIRLHLWRGHFHAFLSSGGLGKGANQVRWIPGVGGVAHNDWFEIMGNLGLIGLIAFLGIHICLFRRMLRIDDVWSKLLCLLMWSFILIASLVQNDYLRKFYPMIVGIVLSIIRLNEAGKTYIGNDMQFVSDSEGYVGADVSNLNETGLS